MNEWTVVTVLIAILGLLTTVVKPVISLTKSITELTDIVRQLGKDMDEQRTSSHESHKRIWAHNKEQDDKLAEHDLKLVEYEGRIQRLERS